MGVRLTMSFFLEAVKRAPLRAPRGIPKVGGEIFRVDAKAEGSTVVIGGWESYGGATQCQMVFSQIGQEEFTVGVRKRGAVQGDCFTGAPRDHCGGYGVPPECQMERGSGTARAHRLH